MILFAPVVKEMSFCSPSANITLKETSCTTWMKMCFPRNMDNVKYSVNSAVKKNLYVQNAIPDSIETTTLPSVVVWMDSMTITTPIKIVTLAPSVAPHAKVPKFA